MNTLIKWLTQITLIWLVLGFYAATAHSAEPLFRHDIPGKVLPWTNEDFDSADGKFTFAVFSDLTGGERDGVFEIAVAQLAMLRPELIINVGDLIEGGSDNPAELEAQWDSFDKRAERATVRVFYVGGNISAQQSQYLAGKFSHS